MQSWFDNLQNAMARNSKPRKYRHDFEDNSYDSDLEITDQDIQLESNEERREDLGDE